VEEFFEGFFFSRICAFFFSAAMDSFNSSVNSAEASMSPERIFEQVGALLAPWLYACLRE
jgi:hypothetical protein